jgi:hypothetical protein
MDAKMYNNKAGLPELMNEVFLPLLKDAKASNQS